MVILEGRPVLFATSYMVGREDKRTSNRTMFPALKNNAAAGSKGPVKLEVLKGAGVLILNHDLNHDKNVVRSARQELLT